MLFPGDWAQTKPYKSDLQALLASPYSPYIQEVVGIYHLNMSTMGTMMRFPTVIPVALLGTQDRPLVSGIEHKFSSGP
uniref:Uncharacterized protein n=1 Tax=Romanomermis culicivorax TaxID=13658 RepID=A0A915KGX3_ROMCU